MTETISPPPGAPQAEHAKTPKWVLVLVAVIVLCCFCAGAVGLIFAFWEPLMDSLGSSGLSGLLSRL